MLLQKDEAITALRETLAQEHALHELSRLGQEIEQEPSAWRDMVVVSLVREGINKHKARELADHFAAQPERRKPLMNKEIWQMVNDCTIGGDLHADKFARAIEAKLKERNT